MNIEHDPLFDTAKLEKLYSEKDGVPVKYVCTSAPNENATYAADIFYRETPHPEFGNRYFGLFSRYIDEVNSPVIMITNADMIEDLVFNMLDINDKLVYSQHRHDYRTEGETSIDGGRSYLKVSGNLNTSIVSLKVKNGTFEIIDNKEQ